MMATLAPLAAHSQTAPDRMRFEWLGGVLMQGDMAQATFQLDTTPFGGILISRTGGGLDVVPSFSFGLRSTYRLKERVCLQGTWMHSEGSYRVRFPALSSEPGDFNLEALLLAGTDFQGAAGTRAESATSLAKTDCYLAGARYEWPVLNRRLYPFFSLGGGIFRQRSGAPVFHVTYEGDQPANVTLAELSGVDPLEGSGISVFTIDSTDILVGAGAGVRASVSSRWGVDVELNDLMRMNADLTSIDASSTPPPDANVGRLWQTTFAGRKGLIHNWSMQVALTYAIWPFGSPR
jgi:hypothetical protein